MFSKGATKHGRKLNLLKTSVQEEMGSILTKADVLKLLFLKTMDIKA